MKALFGCFFLLSTVLLSGANSNLLFEKFTMQDGLPENQVLKIAQDSTGFIWVATESGLARFDGVRFKKYNHDNKNPYSIPHNTVNELFVDSKGNLWVGTQRGICLYDPMLDRFIRFLSDDNMQIDEPFPMVNSIGESSKGIIYFISEFGKLYSIKDNTILLELNLLKDGCKFMVIDEQDQCWIASNTEIFRFDIETNLTTHYDIKFPRELKNTEIINIVKNDSVLYIGAYKSNLIEFNYVTKAFKYYNIADKLAHTSALLKKNNYLYVGTSEGLHVLDLNNGDIVSYTEDVKNVKSLVSNAIIDIFIDNQNNIWVATPQGLNVSYRGSGFINYSYKYNNFNNSGGVNAFYKDKQNRLWVGYQGYGFEIFDEKLNSIKWFMNLPNIMPDSRVGEVFCFFGDEDENLWMGTYLHGLLKYNLKTNKITQYYPDLGKLHIDGADIRAIEADKHGNIWIAIHGKGLSVLVKGSESFISISEFDSNIPSTINHRWIFDFDFDKEGNIWLGTNEGCYNYNFETKQYLHFHTDGGINERLSDNNVRDIFIGSDNKIYLATRMGVNIVSNDRKKITIVDDTDKLPHNIVMAIIEDKENTIWVSTLNGIAKIESVELNKISVTKYDSRNGVGSSNFNKKAAFLSDKNIFYFGNIEGYTVFNPNDIMDDTIPPAIVFTNFYLYNKEVNVCLSDSLEGSTFCLKKNIQFTDEIELKEKDNMFGFQFAALNYANAQQNQIKYMLEGFDKDWINIGNRNTVFYTNIGAGTYTFKVKGSISGNVWSESPTQIKIKILPPFYKTKLAMILYFFSLVAIFLYFNSLSVQKQKILMEIGQQKELREMRTRFFMNVSHELKTPLTLIVVPLKKMIDKYQSISQSPSIDDIAMLYRNVSRLMRIMNQIFDFRKIEIGKVSIKVSKSDIVQFTEAIIEYFEYQLNQKNIKVKTDYPSSGTEFYFDADKMDKILFNLLSNSIKHTSENGNIEIKIIKVVENDKRKAPKEFIYWVIKDSGKGIPEEKIKSIFNRFSHASPISNDNMGGTGIGLSIVKEFTELHHGELSIESKEFSEVGNESYTQVSLKFPMSIDVYKTDEISTSNEASIKIIEDNQWINKLKFTKTSDENYQAQNEINHSCEAYSVLVIDDDPDICKILKDELALSYKVYVANDGKNGVFKAEKYLPDIIISDVMMPEMDGYEVCKTLKSNIDTSHIPILLLTSKSTDEDEKEGYRTGADAFISKPFDLNKLLNRVESLISNRVKLKSTFLASYGIELKKVLPTETDEKFVQKLINIIQNNLSDKNLNSEMISREIGISRSQLYKKINSVANTSVNLFIRSIRLKKAAQLLAEGKLNITEVAYEIGFDNLPYFSKCFNEEFGESPSKYASTHRT